MHGLGASPSVWGVPAPGEATGARGSLHARLLDLGYEPEVTLFVVDGPPGDYLADVTGRLLPAIDRARAVSGQPKVDVVAHGSAALAVRYYAASPAYRRDLRTVVMLGPPNAGSLAAEALYRLALLDAVKPDAVLAVAGRLAQAAGTRPRDLPVPFTDPATYVKARAQELYLPLYHEFSQAGMDTGGRPAGRGRSRAAASLAEFENWLRQRYPGLLEAHLGAGRVPRDEYYLDGDGPFGRPPLAGEDLTLAYYEWTAMAAARHAYLRTVADRPPLTAVDDEALERAARTALEELIAALLRRSGGGGAAREALLRLLTAAGRWLGDRARAVVTDAVWTVWENVEDDAGRRALLWAAARWLGVGADDDTVRRLVTERVPLAGRRTAEATAPLANYFLHTWSAAEAAARRERSARARRTGTDLPDPVPRFVVLAGRALNLWGVVDPDAGAGDLGVEVAATLLPMAENDEFQLFEGLISASHVTLPRHPAVVDYVTEVLSRYHRVASVLAPRAEGAGAVWEGRAQGSAGLWAPQYQEVSGRSLAGGHGRLDLTVEVAAPSQARGEVGVAVAGWLYRETPDGDRVDRVPLAFSGSGRRLAATASVPDFGRGVGRVLVGLRLVPDGSRTPAGLFEAWAERGIGPRLPYEVRASFATAKAGRPEAGRGPAGPGDTSGAPAAPGQEGDRNAGGAGKAGGSGEQGGGPGAGAPEDAGEHPAGPGGGAGGRPPAGQEPAPPGAVSGPTGGREKSITVTLRSKRTTLKRPQEWVHQRWVWERQGQPPLEDPDPAHRVGSLVHVFEPGAASRVKVTAHVGNGASERPLRTAEWWYTGSRPATAELRLESISPPHVRVRLDGPGSWVTGRPARFTVNVEAVPPPNGRVTVVSVDPGPAFLVTWTRAGSFQVLAAVTVRVSYEYPASSGCVSLEDGELCHRAPAARLTVYNIYVASRSIRVLTTTLGD